MTELGDGPIAQAYREKMNTLARFLDLTFNGDVSPENRETGFVLLVFPFGEDDASTSHRCNYISNANRRDVIKLMKEQVARFELQDGIR